ncbi:MAG: two-component regulator propeller domain-containing protein [bacterium]
MSYSMFSRYFNKWLNYFVKELNILTIILGLTLILNAEKTYGLRDFSEKNIKFEHISLNEGLSQSSVHCILQDSRGFMWFGTEDGLNKYDGYDFKVYKQAPHDRNSLSDNFIWTIFEDDSANIWIGTGGGGLNKYSTLRNRFVHFEYDPNDTNCLSSNIVRAIAEDSYGTLWIGTDGGGVCCLDRETGIFTTYRYDLADSHSIGSDYVIAIYEDSDNILWFGTTGGGLNCYDRENGHFIRYLHDPNDPKSISHNTVLSICEDNAGVLWLGTIGGGLNKFLSSNINKTDGSFTCYQHDPQQARSISDNSIMALYGDKNATFWVGTRKGIDIFDKESETFYNYQYNPDDNTSLSHNNILSIYEDNGGRIWIGTTNSGINKYDRNYYKFRCYRHDPGDPNSLSADVMRSVYEDKAGRIWIGTIGGGINIFDRENDNFIQFSENGGVPYDFSGEDITSFCEDHYGKFWIGSWGSGLFMYDRATHEITQHRYNPDDILSLNSNNVQVIFEDSKGVLWVGTDGGGLNQFDYSTEVFKHYRHDPNDPTSISNNNIQSMAICEDDEGFLWIGTWNGLNRFNSSTGEFTHFFHDPDDHQSIINDHVISITKSMDNDSILWIGTTGGLSKLYLTTKRFSNYTLDDGLPNDVIYAILEDNDRNLWMSTNNGLSKFNPAEESFRNYDVREGLQSNQFFWGAACKAKTGELYFGGTKGLNVFDPEKITENSRVPLVYLTSFKIFNREINFDKDLSLINALNLSYKENYISFDFVALNYTIPEKNQYAYYMEGFDKDWIYPGTRRYASYMNLPPGDYTFRVKASNNDNVWNEEGIAISIIVIPPFWQKLWFKITVLIVGLVSLMVFYEARIHTIRRQQQKLQIQVAEKTRDLRGKNDEIESKNRNLEKALKDIKTLSGLVPICANCKKIRNDDGYYEHVEKYVMDHSDAVFSHGICPDCMEKLYPQYAKKKKSDNDK